MLRLRGLFRKARVRRKSCLSHSLSYVGLVCKLARGAAAAALAAEWPGGGKLAEGRLPGCEKAWSVVASRAWRLQEGKAGKAKR